MEKSKVILMGSEALEENNKQRELAKYLYDALYSKKESLSPAELNEYNEKLVRIINGEPAQYVIGNVNFYGYKFNIDKNVLIPRFETEELVYYAIKYINNYFTTSISIADIGTGSGVIAITLKKELPNCNIVATDISPSAIKIAKRNSKLLDADIKFLVGDMLEPLKGQKLDVIISNPPYIKESEEIEKIVSAFEPNLALYGGVDGLKYYQQIFINAPNILNDKFIIALEISDSIKEAILKLVNKYFKTATYKIIKDMAGRDRILFIFNKID